MTPASTEQIQWNNKSSGDEDFRDDVVSWYISFLKSISLRLSPNIVRFFYNEVS